MPDAPAQYAALVRLHAQAEAGQVPDPVSHALTRLAALCEAALCARTAARLGVPWPALPVPATALAGVAFTPAEQATRAMLGYVDAAYGLIACFEGLGTEAIDALRAWLARRPGRPVRPVRSLRALHAAWCLAWHGAHAGRVRAPAFAACLVTLGAAARAVAGEVERIAQSPHAGAPGAT